METLSIYDLLVRLKFNYQDANMLAKTIQMISVKLLQEPSLQDIVLKFI